eukprot:441652-Amorphochlora_amoeboformis.AAC.1
MNFRRSSPSRIYPLVAFAAFTAMVAVVTLRGSHGTLKTAIRSTGGSLSCFPFCHSGRICESEGVDACARSTVGVRGLSLGGINRIRPRCGDAAVKIARNALLTAYAE